MSRGSKYSGNITKIHSVQCRSLQMPDDPSRRNLFLGVSGPASLALVMNARGSCSSTTLARLPGTVFILASMGGDYSPVAACFALLSAELPFWFQCATGPVRERQIAPAPSPARRNFLRVIRRPADVGYWLSLSPIRPIVRFAKPQKKVPTNPRVILPAA